MGAPAARTLRRNGRRQHRDRGAGAAAGAVRRAAEATGVRAFTRLDARLGPAGAGLSDGERQQIALARAVLRCRALDTPVLLLDEPTDPLDVLTEIEFAETVREL